MEQRTEEWHKARLGKITASKCHLLTKTARGGGFTDSAKTYMMEKVAEILTLTPTYTPTTPAMQWGIDHEEEAKRVYMHHTKTKIIEKGFVTVSEDEPMCFIGASPDGLIELDGSICSGVEIKCPYNSTNHVRYMLGFLPNEYYSQIQLNMAVFKLDKWDFVSYDPRFKVKSLYIRTIERDEAFIENLLKRCCDSIIEMNDMMDKIKYNT